MKTVNSLKQCRIVRQLKDIDKAVVYESFKKTFKFNTHILMHK